MKILKGAVVAFSLAAAMGSFSTAAVAACESGRTCFTPAQAIDNVIAGINDAEHAIGNGATGAEVAALVKIANDRSEEINANDVVARNTSKARNHLKAAIKAAKEDNLSEAEEHLKKAKPAFEGLKKMI